MSNKEQRIQRALNDLDLGLFRSIGQAANYYGVAKSTVAHRRKGRESRTNTQRISQRLSDEEEKALIQYLRDLQRQNLCPNYPKIREMVYAILTNKGDRNPLGKHYISRLISRHSDLKKGHTRAMDIKRVSALDIKTVERFFTELTALEQQYSVEQEDI